MPAGILPLMPVIIGADLRSERFVLGGIFRIIVANRDQRRDADRHRIRAQRHRLGDIRAVADTARNNQLHLTMNAKILQRLNRGLDAGERRLTDILNKHFLRRRRAALHPVKNDNIRASLHRQRRVVIGARACNFDVRSALSSR